MKHLLLLLFFILSSINVFAQDSELTWVTNIDTAKAYAEAQDKNILLVFAGSDWCRPCIQFKNDILESTDFQEWGMDKLVILYLDFPAKKKNRLSSEETEHNELLAERFNKSGIFPNIILINPSEEILTKLEFRNQSVEDFIEMIP